MWACVGWPPNVSIRILEILHALDTFPQVFLVEGNLFEGRIRGFIKPWDFRAQNFSWTVDHCKRVTVGVVVELCELILVFHLSRKLWVDGFYLVNRALFVRLSNFQDLDFLPEMVNHGGLLLDYLFHLDYTLFKPYFHAESDSRVTVSSSGRYLVDCFLVRVFTPKYGFLNNLLSRLLQSLQAVLELFDLCSSLLKLGILFLSLTKAFYVLASFVKTLDQWEKNLPSR